MIRSVACLAAWLLAGICAVASAAEDMEDKGWGPGPLPDWILTPAYEKRNTDAAAAERGRTLFGASGCSFCHGNEARGGNGGPNLLRSQSVLSDQHGETIAGPIRKGVPGSSMVAFTLSDAEIADVAEFLHSFKVDGNEQPYLKPAQFTLGNASAGRRYFVRHCSSCHQIDRDLKGIGRKYAQPRTLQQRWLMPRDHGPTLATVALADGTAVSGQLRRMDEFLITLVLADGTQRTLARDGDAPHIELHDPLATHKALLPTYRDTDIHDVTAYLASLK